MSQQQTPQVRLRIRFEKRGPLRYSSHLDLARTWERLCRRAGLNVVYSQGFNPRPKMQLAAALPLGFSSSCELLDVWLTAEDLPDFAGLRGRLQAVAPDGLSVTQVEAVALRGPALQTLTRAATYQITFRDVVDSAALRQAVEGALDADEIIRERRGKRYNLRPMIHNLSVEHYDANGQTRLPRLVATLNLGQGATGRPDELLRALGLDAAHARIERVAIHFAEEGIETPA